MPIHVNQEDEKAISNSARSTQNKKQVDMRVNIGSPTLTNMNEGDSGIYFTNGKLKFVSRFQNQLYAINFERL